MFSKLKFWLKVSRPGLWFATIWLYILPTSQMDILNSPAFWTGMFYICFPLNFLVYGWNDIVDYEIDKINPRKDSFFFGARGTQEQLSQLWKPILITQLIMLPFLIWFGGWLILVLIGLQVLINWIYNLPEKGLRSRPPWELLCQIGYLLVVPLSVLINDTVQVPVLTYLYLFLFAMQSHLMGEVMDYIPDKLSGRITTATKIGVKNTKLLIIIIVSAEVLLLLFAYQEWVFGGFLAAVLLWLIIDLTLVFKSQEYSIWQMKLFGWTSNITALATMLYVWQSGCLL